MLENLCLSYLVHVIKHVITLICHLGGHISSQCECECGHVTPAFVTWLPTSVYSERQQMMVQVLGPVHSRARSG